MQKSFLFLITLFFLFSCSDDDVSVPVFCENENCDFDCITDLTPTDVITNGCQDNHECSFNFLADSKIDTDEFNGVKNGNKNVFQFIISTEGEANIADDEFTDILVFELDPEQESFEVESTQLEGMKAHFRQICFCAETDFMPVKIGCMQGKKLEYGKWAIQGNIEVEYSWGNLPILFEAEFE